jgi:hypothetical protein
VKQRQRCFFTFRVEIELQRLKRFGPTIVGAVQRALASGKKLMTWCTQAIVLCVCLSGNALAADRVNRAHTPPQSPFHATEAEILEPSQGTIEYEGRTAIRAKYRFVFDEENGYEQNPHLFLKPDLASRSTLPYLTRWVFDSANSSEMIERTDKAEEIWVTNVSEAAALLLGKRFAEEVLAGKHEKVSGEAEVVVEGFSAGYQCDNPSFGTRLVEVRREIVAPSASKRSATGC